MRAPLITAILLLLPVVSYSACALETLNITSEFEDRQFRCEVITVLDAPVAAVEAVLRDYESYPLLDARILKSRVIERPTPTTALLETTLRACFGPFCRRVRRVEAVQESPNALSAITDPKHSDMRFGETHTSIEAIDGARPRVVYRTGMSPDFWVPAVGARASMLRTLEEATITLFKNVEARAQARDEAGA